MVFNPEYNFLYIHIQKTAGTSITKGLLTIPSSQFIPFAHLRLRDINFTTKTKPFIFTVVRNPFDRLVSWYEMMQRKNIHNDFSRYLLHSGSDEYINKVCGFSDFIRRTEIIEETDVIELGQCKIDKTDSFVLPPKYLKSISFNQVDYLTDMSDQVICNRIMRFENISSAWADLVEDLKLPIKSTLDYENVNPRKINTRNYYLNAADREWIMNLYRKDFEFFDYKINF